METLSGKSVALPNQLAAILQQEGINVSENVANYPLLQREFSPEESIDIERVKGVLMTLPLTHSSDRRITGDIAPFSEKTVHGRDGNTGGLDESLGLDSCVFMQWGAVEKSGGYGRYHVLVDPSFILNSPDCFVTPDDVCMVTFDQEPRYETLTSEVKDEISSRYFSRILSGKDWLELTARQVYLETLAGNPVVIDSPKKFGEIKFCGTIPESQVLSCIGPEDEKRVWAEMYRNGFVAGPVHRSDNSSTAYDPTPADLGMNGDEAQAFWDAFYHTEPGVVIA